MNVVQENNPLFIGGERVGLVRTGTYVEVVPDIADDTNGYAGPQTEWLVYNRCGPMVVCSP